MDLSEAKIIADTKLWPVIGVSRDKGRRDLEKLEQLGDVSPRRTPTGRAELSFKDVLAIAKFYGIEATTGTTE